MPPPYSNQHHRTCHCGKVTVDVPTSSTRLALSCGPSCYSGCRPLDRSLIPLYERPCRECGAPVFSAKPSPKCNDCVHDELVRP